MLLVICGRKWAQTTLSRNQWSHPSMLSLIQSQSVPWREQCTPAARGPEAAPLSSLQPCGGQGAELSHLMMVQCYKSLISYPITFLKFLLFWPCSYS